MLRLIAVGAVLLPFAAMAAAPPRDAVEKPTEARDKVICKRFLETGSLVRAQRICKTRDDWDRDRAQARQLDTTRACGGAGTEALCR